MVKGHLCVGRCQAYKQSKPPNKSRYSVGQVQCLICNVWLDYRGCHLKNGSKAKSDSLGMFCNCCNFRVRTKPRNTEYKNQLSNFSTSDDFSFEDLYVSKIAAGYIKKIIFLFPQNLSELDIDELENDIPESTTRFITQNFGISIKKFLEFLTDFETLNHFSIMSYFEILKRRGTDVPTKEIFLESFEIEESVIDDFFKSWEHFVEMMGYDPFYRNQSSNDKFDSRNSNEYEEPNALTMNKDSTELGTLQSSNVDPKELLKEYLLQKQLQIGIVDDEINSQVDLLEAYLKIHSKLNPRYSLEKFLS